MNAPLITFDLFSALMDSRSGGTAFFQSLAEQRSWPVRGQGVYDAWDARNKHAQAHAQPSVLFVQLGETALQVTYEHYALSGNPDTDWSALRESIAGWPLWPDVRPALTELTGTHRVGILSNVDDDILATTQVWPLIDPVNALTSQRLGCYKPNPMIYRIARDDFGVQLHVAASSRDVRGAAEANMPHVRIARPGHRIDPAGPAPQRTIHSLRGLTG